MGALGWVILVVVILVLVGVVFGILRRRHRGGRVIATKDKS